MLSAHLSRTETPQNIEPLYTTEQVARLLRVSQRCVQVWIRDGVLPGVLSQVFIWDAFGV